MMAGATPSALAAAVKPFAVPGEPICDHAVDAIGLAIRSFEASKVESRILILLSDIMQLSVGTLFAAAVGLPVPPTRVGTLRWADILG